MRVGLVTEFYYPHLGGITEHVHNLAHELTQLGHTALIITSRMSGAAPDPPHVRRVGTSRLIYSNGAFSRMTVGWQLRSQLAALFKAEKLDVVHVHGPLAPTLGVLAPQAAIRVGIPVVGTFHSWFPRSVGYRLFRAPLQRLLDRFDASIAVSEPVITSHARYFKARWDLIPNGIDLELFQPEGRKPFTEERLLHLLFLGRLDPRNGLATVLEAMPRIQAVHAGARLVVAGGGPLRGWYERRAERPGIRFLGPVYHRRPALYREADLYVCPTTRASFGITLLEAMACGTPMIVSDIPGFRELVGGGEALLVDPHDSAAWAEAAAMLLADPARRQAMGEEGRRRAAHYAWPSVARQIETVYRRVAR
jgi:phosphatidylinositol alpha-mannosyltransferase